MGAVQVMEGLRAAGFTLKADGDRLTVFPGGKLSDPDRHAIRAHKSELLVLLGMASGRVEPPTKPGADTSGTDTPDDAAARPRLARMARLGWTEARALLTADRLRTRDSQEDDRRMCLECSHLGDSGRCVAAAMGRLRSADRRLEPVPDLLQRCEAFGLRKGLP
jgi:hypothetical protein